jgi:H+-transporting ATPase
VAPTRNREKATSNPLACRQILGPGASELEATIVLELALGKFVEGIVIAVPLGFNASLSLFQETRVRSALELLEKRLAVRARRAA